VLPLPVLWKPNICWKQKIALIGVFLLGFLYVVTIPDGLVEKQLTSFSVCLTLILRLVSVYIDPSDIAYDFSLRAYWAAVKVNLAIICACLTTLKPLLAQAFLGLIEAFRGKNRRKQP